LNTKGNIQKPGPQTRESVKALLCAPIAGGEHIKEEIEARNFLCRLYSESFPTEALFSAKLILDASSSINFKAGELMAHLVFAFLQHEGKETEQGQAHMQAAATLLEDPALEFRHRAMGVHLCIYSYWARGEYTIAFDKTFDLLKQIDKIKDPTSIGWIHYALGIFNYDIKDYVHSIEYYTKALGYFERSEDELQRTYGSARSKTGIATGYIQLKNYAEAETLLKESLEVYRHLVVHTGVSRVLNDLATIEKIRGNFAKALEFQLEAYQIRDETNHPQGKLTSLNELGEIYFNLGEFKTSEKYLLEAKNLGEFLLAKAKTFRAHQLLSQLYKKTGQPEKALEHYEKFHELKEEVLGQNSTNEIKRLQNQFEREKSEKEAEIERLKNVELKNAHEAISLKNKEILDSIHYAKRIQQSLLPTEIFIERILKELKK